MNRLFSAIEDHARQKPDLIALQGSRQAWAYNELLPAIMAKAEILEQNNVTVLGIQLPNGPDWILWDLAALMAGIICVPLPPFFTPEQTAHSIRSAGISHIQMVEGLEATGAVAMPIPMLTSKVTFTSGTTGTPKGVCLSADALTQVADSLTQVLGSDFAQNHLSLMPLSILLENVAGVYTALMAGATVHIPDAGGIGMGRPFQPDFVALGRYVADHNITSMILVPELLRGVMLAAAHNQPLFSSLRFVAVGGSKVAPKMIQAAWRLGLPVYEGYGLSECGSVVSLNAPDDDYPGTSGKLLSHVRAEIRDGEIVILNPAFLGYLGDGPRASSVFATGDLGCIDQNNAVLIEGRKKNIIITSFGRNIAPEWIESLLLSQPEIGQALVYGNDRPAPGALIVPSMAGADVDAAVARANHMLPAYARIESYHVVAPFTLADGTLTGTGRCRRQVIMTRYQTLIAQGEDDEFLRQAG